MDRVPLEAGLLPRGVRQVCGDYANKSFLTEALRDVDAIVALAYSTVPKASFDDPVQDILSNLPPSVGLLQVVSDLPIKKIVIISSGGTVYGITRSIPITEDHPTNPISPYGITKLALEKYALMFWQLNGLPVVVVRPSNVYGEGQRPHAGQGLVATAIASILEGREITLFGDRDSVRDYLHVDDVAEGIVAALMNGHPGSCNNIGSGIGRSNRDVLDALYPLARTVDLEPMVKVLPPRPFDVPFNVLDCGKFSTDTGWHPKISFDVGIERTWQWFRNGRYLT
jgi:UDP-glucose 4-epimerase